MLSLENVLSLQWSGRSNPGSFCEANLAETRFNFLLFYWNNGDSCDVMIILKCIVTFEALSHRTPLKVCLICAMGIHQNIHAPMKLMWVPSSVEVQSYKASNVLNHLCNQNEQFLHHTVIVRRHFISLTY